MWTLIIWLMLGSTFIFIIGIACIAGSAYLEVKNAPKEIMEYCSKHGPLRKQHLLTFFDINYGYCWLCWHDAMKAAERNGKK